MQNCEGGGLLSGYYVGVGVGQVVQLKNGDCYKCIISAVSNPALDSSYEHQSASTCAICICLCDPQNTQYHAVSGLTLALDGQTDAPTASDTVGPLTGRDINCLFEYDSDPGYGHLGGPGPPYDFPDLKVTGSPGFFIASVVQFAWSNTDCNWYAHTTLSRPGPRPGFPFGDVDSSWAVVLKGGSNRRDPTGAYSVLSTTYSGIDPDPGVNVTGTLTIVAGPP